MSHKCAFMFSSTHMKTVKVGVTNLNTFYSFNTVYIQNIIILACNQFFKV